MISDHIPSKNYPRHKEYEENNKGTQICALKINHKITINSHLLTIFRPFYKSPESSKNVENWQRNKCFCICQAAVHKGCWRLGVPCTWAGRFWKCCLDVEMVSHWLFRFNLYPYCTVGKYYVIKTRRIFLSPTSCSDSIIADSFLQTTIPHWEDTLDQCHSRRMKSTMILKLRHQ